MIMNDANESFAKFLASRYLPYVSITLSLLLFFGSVTLFKSFLDEYEKARADATKQTIDPLIKTGEEVIKELNKYGVNLFGRSFYHGNRY